MVIWIPLLLCGIGLSEKARFSSSTIDTSTIDTTQPTLSQVSQVCYASAMELKSKREAAEMLGVSTRGIERAVRRGQLTVQYRDSKHGKKAWFRPVDLERYRLHQEARIPVGFTTPAVQQLPPPGPGPGPGPTIGAVIPVVDIEAWPRKRKDKGKQVDNPVPIA